MIKLKDLLCEKKKNSRMVAGMAIFRKKDGKYEVLLAKRKNGGREGEWEVPGGHTEKNEFHKEAAIRESQEETGIKINSSKVKFIKEIEVERRKDISYYLYATIVDYNKSKPKHPTKEHSKLEWFKLHKVPKMDFKERDFILAAEKVSGLRETLQKFVDDSKLLTENTSNLKGRLIVFEGIDGAGKTTQTQFLEKYLSKHNDDVVMTKWNSSSLIKEATSMVKSQHKATPLLYSLLHAADMVERYQNIIYPALVEGKTVISDRYYYTSYVRDGIRGISDNLLNEVYKSFVKPNVLFHCSVPVEVALSRVNIRKEGKELGYYSSGMDMNLSENCTEACNKYLNLCNEKYHKILPVEECYCKIDGNREITEVVNDIRNEILLDHYLTEMLK